MNSALDRDATRPEHSRPHAAVAVGPFVQVGLWPLIGVVVTGNHASKPLVARVAVKGDSWR